MGRFVLDCDSLSSKINEFTNISNQLQGLSDFVSGFPCDNGEFDFSSAVNCISGNIVACSKKVNNTAVLISNVIDSHTKLQSTLKFDLNSLNGNNRQTTSNTSRSSSSGGYYGYTSSRGGGTSRSSVSGATSSYSSGNALGNSASVASAISGATTLGEVNKYSINIDGVEGTAIDIPSGLGSVHTYMGWQMITARGSDQYKLKEEAGMNFDSEGFGKIGDRYVIACTTTFGNVGDCVDFVQEDGSVIKCVIGDIKSQQYTSYDHNPANKWGHNNGQCIVEFVVDKSSWYNCNHPNPGNKTCHPEWNQNLVKAINYGNYKNYLSKDV